MKFPLHLLSLILVCNATLMLSQEKVAEGEYWVEGTAPSGAPQAIRATHWTVYEKSPGHFRLESECEKHPAGLRVVQTEDLTDRFVPTTIGYELYRKDQAIPSISATCDFASGALVCTGNAGKDQASPSAPYKPQGAFVPWIEGLSSLDLPWLMAGALNMAQWDKGRAQIETLIVSGGSGVMIGDALNMAALQSTGKPITFVGPDKPTPWSFSSADRESLQFIASETAELQGEKVAVKHYASTDSKEQGGMWITDSGLLTKMTAQENLSFVLKSYKQYRKIIPELPAEKAQVLKDSR
jgi:hypothetical protein